MHLVDELTKHYNKFNEDKRLSRPHGRVEFLTTMHYIHKYLEVLSHDDEEKIRILDLGAGTGAYSIPLAQEGYDVTAVEYVKYNLGRLKQKAEQIKNGLSTGTEEGQDKDQKSILHLQAYQGDARKLRRFADDSFDLTLLFGPMYHLYTTEDKLTSLMEAARVTRPGGYLLVAYLMNEYGVLTYGFKEGNVKECLADGRLDTFFHCHSREEDLYDYVRLEDIDALNAAAGLMREKIISVDGPADYLRKELHAMDEETFSLFMQYHLSTCERPELLGAAAHTLDILRV